MPVHPVACVPFVAIALLTSAGPAFAQASTEQGRHGGLFGGADTRPARHALDVTLTAEGAHDTDTAPEVASATGDTFFGGYSTIVTGGLDYRFTRSRFGLTATGSSVWRRYAEAADVRSASHSGGIGFTASLDPRTTLTANQSLAYSPSYLYGLFPSAVPPAPGDSLPPATDYRIEDTVSYYSATDVRLTHGISRRSSISGAGRLDITKYAEEAPGRPDLDDRTGQVDYLHHLTKNVVARGGYQYRNGTFAYEIAGAGPGLRTTEHLLTTGMDYTRPLSATRQLTLAFTVGTSLMDVPVAEEAGLDHEALRRFSGDFQLSWDFAPRWQARAAVQRGAEYLATLGEPVYQDSFSVALSGLVHDRVDVSVRGAYSNGQSALSRGSLLLETYSADARVQVALSRTLAAYGQGLFYHYAFDGGRTPAGLAPNLDRTGVRGGLTMWLPAFRR